MPIPGISQQPTWSALTGLIKARQGAAYIGDDRVAYMICERDPSFCHGYVFGQPPAGSNKAVKAINTPMRPSGGCGSCAKRAAERAAKNNGGRVR